MPSTIPVTIADFETQLSTAISIGDTAFSIESILDDDGNTIPDGKYCLATDNGSSKKEYLIGDMVAGDFTNVKSVTRQGVEIIGAIRAHRVGALVLLTDFATIQRVADILRGVATLDGGAPLSYDISPTLSDPKQIATVAYVLSVVTGGSVTFSSQIINVTYGETIVAKDILYFKESDQKWWKADADLSATFDQVKLGIAQASGNASEIKPVLISGPSSNFTGLTPGSKYYLSNTAGGVTTSNAQTTTVFLGWAINSTTMLFDPQSIYGPTKLEKDFLTAQVSGLVGVISPYAGRTAPSGYLPCDGSLVSRATYVALLGILCPSGTFTVTIASPAVFTKVAHGFVAGDKVHFKTTGALPTGLSIGTEYYVISSGLAADTFRVALSPEGTVVNTSGSQSGVHTVYSSNWGLGDGSTTFALPDLRSKTLVGKGQGSDTLKFESGAVNTGSDSVTIPNYTFPVQGQAVVLTTTGTLPTGLSLATTYYIIRDTDTTIKFASSQANANAGIIIDITGAGSGVHTMTFTNVNQTLLAAKGGEEKHSLAKKELAAHRHQIGTSASGPSAASVISTSSDASGSDAYAYSDGTAHEPDAIIQHTGDDIQHNNMNPFAVINWIIKY